MKQYALQSASKICIIRKISKKYNFMLFLLSSKQRVCADCWNLTCKTENVRDGKKDLDNQTSAIPITL